MSRQPSGGEHALDSPLQRLVQGSVFPVLLKGSDVGRRHREHRRCVGQGQKFSRIVAEEADRGAVDGVVGIQRRPARSICVVVNRRDRIIEGGGQRRRPTEALFLGFGTPQPAPTPVLGRSEVEDHRPGML